MIFRVTDEACPHTWSDGLMNIPKPSQLVHRDECAYCCVQAHQEDGIYVCMTCFTGVCKSHVEKHMAVCPEHCLFTRVFELPTVKPNVDQTKDVQTLCLVPNKTYNTDICCAACSLRFLADPQIPGLASESYTAIINTPVPGAAPTSDNPTDFQMMLCPHLLTLEQLYNPFAPSGPPQSIKCNEPDCLCTENCWMCMTCGFIGCSRQSSGGNGHALQHKTDTDHNCCVKLGTITAAGADIYCYTCDDMVRDEYFPQHMGFFGIDINTAKKTAKTMGELEYDYSTSFDFNKITEAGQDLELVRGPGRTGIRNIGNSCYISSVVQCCMAMAPFRHSFYPSGSKPHQASCSADPYKCCYCQLERVAEGLLSGKFCAPPPTSSNNNTEDVGGISPRLLKNVIAGTHPDFSTGMQQDAQEYMLFFLEKLQHQISLQQLKKNITSVRPSAAEVIANHPASLFAFRVENRVECHRCHKVRYSTEEDACLTISPPVAQELMASTAALNATLSEEQKSRPTYELQECIDTALAAGNVDCRCEACGKDTVYKNTMRFQTFPDILPIFIRRAYFDVATLTTKKFEVFVNVPQEIDLNYARATGKKEGEVLMESSGRSSQRLKTEPSNEVDEMLLATVLSMGFDQKAATFALQRNGMSVEKAIEYLFSGVDVEAEIAAEESSKAAAAAASPSTFTDGNGRYRLFAMISHIGAAAKTGHYVCHIKEEATGKWLLFNDEKVGISNAPPFALASLYFFERI